MSERPQRKGLVPIVVALAASLAAAASVFWFSATSSRAGWSRVRFVQPRFWSFGTKQTLVSVPVAQRLRPGDTARVDFAPAPARPGGTALWSYVEFHRHGRGTEMRIVSQKRPPTNPARLLVTARIKQVGFDPENLIVLGRTTKFGPIAIDSSPFVTVRP